jgi:hypothetical protein
LMSLTDKVSNGLVVVAIQTYIPLEVNCLWGPQSTGVFFHQLTQNKTNNVRLSTCLFTSLEHQKVFCLTENNPVFCQQTNLVLSNVLLWVSWRE